MNTTHQNDSVKYDDLNHKLTSTAKTICNRLCRRCHTSLCPGSSNKSVNICTDQTYIFCHVPHKLHSTQSVNTDSLISFSQLKQQIAIHTVNYVCELWTLLHLPKAAPSAFNHKNLSPTPTNDTSFNCTIKFHNISIITRRLAKTGNYSDVYSTSITKISYDQRRSF